MHVVKNIYTCIKIIIVKYIQLSEGSFYNSAAVGMEFGVLERDSQHLQSAFVNRPPQVFLLQVKYHQPKISKVF